MVSLTFRALSLSLLVGSTLAHPASPLAVAIVKEQFKNALIVPSIVPQFEPNGLLYINYTESIAAPFDNGAQLSLTNVTQPGYSIKTVIRGLAEGFVTQGSPYNDTNSRYTVLAFDAGYPGANQTSQYYLHYLANDLQYVALNDNRITINSTQPARVAYSPPNPPAGSGPHRYIWLAYNQQDGFQPPANPPAGTTVNLFNFTQYISDSGLGNPFAGTYFTVETGDRASNLTIAETSPVNSMTLPQYTETGTSSAAPHSTAAGNSASQVRLAIESGSFAILVGGAGALLGAALLL